MANINVLLLGPYTGDFCTEITQIRPHFRWASVALKHDKLVISSHQNKAFMYEWADKFFPISKEYENQNTHSGSCNIKLDKKEYLIYAKTIRDEIAEQYNTQKKDVRIYSAPYSNTPAQYSVYQKVHEKIAIQKCLSESISNDTILYIPDWSENERKLEEIYKLLCKEGKVKIAGDAMCHMQDIKFLNDHPDCVYEYIIKWMDECKIVVCPASHWTFLAKLQGKKVFSWGDIAKYKNGNSAFLMASDTDTSSEKIIKQLMFNMEENALC